jgi:hypothetical protein
MQEKMEKTFVDALGIMKENNQYKCRPSGLLMSDEGPCPVFREPESLPQDGLTLYRTKEVFVGPVTTKARHKVLCECQLHLVLGQNLFL